MNLYEAIRHARKELGLSQAKLSELARVQRRQISTLERGANVTLATVAKILPHLPNLRTFTFECVTVEVRRRAHDPFAAAVLEATDLLVTALRILTEEER